MEAMTIRARDRSMLIGAHAIIYSRDAAADRAFLKDVLGLSHVDAGGGWLIFGLPPAEVAVHPGDENDVHELYLMPGDVDALVTSMERRGIETSPISEQRWGRLTQLRLPGGGKLGVYQPRHASPPRRTTRRASNRTAKAGRTPAKDRATKRPR
jgi:hypothetical protein